MPWEATGNILEKTAKLLVTGFWGLFVCILLFCILPPLEMFMFQKGKKFISVFKNRIEKLLPYTAFRPLFVFKIRK